MVSAKKNSDPHLAALLPACLADLRIAIGDVPETLGGTTASGILWQAAPDKLLLDIPDLARVLVSRDEIIVMPLAPHALGRIGPLLRGTPFAAVMFLRGHFACNGAAVAGPDGAVLLAGRTATGKSTLALALMQRGLRLLADDAASIMLDHGGAAVIAPVWPEVINWSDAGGRLFENAVPPWLEQYPYPATDYAYWKIRSDRFCPTEMPLKAIYHLRRDRFGDGAKRIPVAGLEMLARRMIVPYQETIADAFIDAGRLLRLYRAVSARCPIIDVSIPIRNGDSLHALADGIMQDCGWHTSI